jgi:hypothetical protein
VEAVVPDDRIAAAGAIPTGIRRVFAP